jgi:hypothetical protein
LREERQEGGKVCGREREQAMSLSGLKLSEWPALKSSNLEGAKAAKALGASLANRSRGLCLGGTAVDLGSHAHGQIIPRDASQIEAVSSMLDGRPSLPLVGARPGRTYLS